MAISKFNIQKTQLESSIFADLIEVLEKYLTNLGFEGK